MSPTTNETVAEGGLRHPRFRFLLARCRDRPRIPMGVIHPCSAVSLEGALDAAARGLIEPWLFGPEAQIRQLADTLGRGLEGVTLRDASDAHAAARAAALAGRRGDVAALMKGDIHTADLMHVLLDRDAGVRGSGRMSHAFAIDTPAYSHPVVISDAVIHVHPGLEEKRDICQNAIGLAQTIGIEHRRVAVLAAVETVHEAMPATLHAAALAKMAERGQIVGADLEGPLALDNAISHAAADMKHIEARVAGRANILIAPDLESGNLLAKAMVLLADGIAAGIVLGASIPVALTSRADSPASRVASAAMAVLEATRTEHPLG
ncbi:bifunctional enoyl-CoA hydratase/phosphate acetyltransferase [Luteibacter jiangsuensis]|uniref:Bifunctional enoyl-CoA hydratase/phosphate acetyltransferase n=1 Tax=Luteibacter jiangsuensis TaxID=637577 RepID=A0ABX0PXZ7_9GAMM|nr:bifunctional enoyl-CoA hydratase/phosphate acetyltransferase [Luteibacter jiangsuensis]NID03371.1 bifunctional enoyl-CoA hydratase/phosphate acetyltransferase [Luteibacter jiangsuensis]